MPPWAQTEWERLTGTREKRSTGMWSSASFMAAARPARPPPTTMTRFWDMVNSLQQGKTRREAGEIVNARGKLREWWKRQNGYPRDQRLRARAGWFPGRR